MSSTPRATADPRSTCRRPATSWSCCRSSGRRPSAATTEGRLTVGGIDVVTLAAEHGTAAYVLDEDDFRSRARDFRDSFATAFERLAGADVYYAGKAFLCTAVARWVAEEGLHLDVCTGGELAVARRAGLPRGADRLPRQQQVRRRDPRRPVLRRRPHRRRLLPGDRPHRRRRGRPRRRRAGHGPRHGGRRGAHPRVHRDRPRGPEVRLQPRRAGTPRRPHAASWRRPDVFDLRGLHSHIGSQIFDTGGFETAAHRLVGLHARDRRRARPPLPRDRPRRWLRHRLHLAAHPAARGDARRGDGRHRRARAQGRRRRRHASPAAGLGRARPGHRRPEHVHALRGRHGQGRRARRRSLAHATSPSTAG